MKRILTALLVVSVSCGVALAATTQSNEQATRAKTVSEKAKLRMADERRMPEPDVQLARLSEGLQLSEEQQKQIKPVLDNEFVKLKEIREDENLSPKQIQKKLEELRTDTIGKINSYLTPAQQEKYKLVSSEIKANKQQRIRENRKALIGTKSNAPAK